MTLASTSPYEQALRAQLATVHLSSSHSHDHLDRVLAFALKLHGIYGGDLDILSAAVLLHDLGRSDVGLHGAESAALSAQRAEDVLSAINFPLEKVTSVLQAISEHDQPDFHPTILESRILKDADFLAGMGALGIARSAMWTGESGGTLSDLVDRLVRKMPARIASLEFPESRQQAMGEYIFVALFASKLLAAPSLVSLPAMPYVVFEGISGSGKSTQVDMLAARLSRHGLSPKVVREPTTWFRQFKSSLTLSDKPTELALLLVDRYLNLAGPIEKALAENQPVISDRSYISSMVYQASDGDLLPASIALMHRLMPQPTTVILLDVQPEVALARVDERVRLSHSSLGMHETLEQFAIHRQRFLSLQSIFPLMHVLESQRSPEELHDLVWKSVVADMPRLSSMA